MALIWLTLLSGTLSRFTMCCTARRKLSRNAFAASNPATP
jgi:hypothetical protein